MNPEDTSPLHPTRGITPFRQETPEYYKESSQMREGIETSLKKLWGNPEKDRPFFRVGKVPQAGRLLTGESSYTEE